jgi:O-antigen/teichoic acid export membrane protein
VLTEPKQAQAPPKADAKHHVAFFRQSGWLMMASVVAGALMWAVHFLAKRIPDSEYGVVVTLLSVTMCIPSGPLQMVFAHQSAADLATDRQASLAGKIRSLWIATFILWVIVAAVILWAQKTILTRWEITNPLALYVTLGIVLLSFWLPMFSGLLQGKQDFFGLGWSTILNGAGRIGAGAVLVLAFGAWSTGVVAGILTGLAVATAVAVWRSRDLWAARAGAFDWRSLLAEVVPLMLGFGACQVLFTTDTMFVKSYFPAAVTAYYGAAGTLSRALVWVIGPLTLVMFPKIVHSTARAEKIDLLTVTLISTLVLAGGGAIGLCLFGPWVVKLVYKESYVQMATALLPWYAGAMLPLSIANVLVNNLLARSQFRVVPWTVLLAIAYAVTMSSALRAHPESPVLALKIVAGYSLALLAVCAWFTWGSKPNAARLARPQPG